MSCVVWRWGALTKRQETELKVTELKVLGSSLGVTRIRNEYIRGIALKVRGKAEIFGHAQRKDSG